MPERVPIGVVIQDGDRYVGRCDEVGTTSSGQSVAAAFANLRVATWRRLAAHDKVERCAAGDVDERRRPPTASGAHAGNTVRAATLRERRAPLHRNGIPDHVVVF